jgi:hypothetical protein
MYYDEPTFFTNNVSSSKLFQEAWVSFDALCYSFMNSLNDPSKYGKLVYFSISSLFSRPTPMGFIICYTQGHGFSMCHLLVLNFF